MKYKVNDHAHEMHKGPHHDMFVHADNRSSGYVKAAKPTSAYQASLKPEDVACHNGKMTSGTGKSCS